MASSWVLRPAAQEDLAAIWRHGAATWGPDQADRYIDGLFAVFDLIAEHPELARTRTEFTPPVRIHPSGSHLVIYLAEGGTVDILRLLHALQSLAAFLSEG